MGRWGRVTGVGVGGEQSKEAGERKGGKLDPAHKWERGLTKQAPRISCGRNALYPRTETGPCQSAPQASRRW